MNIEFKRSAARKATTLLSSLANENRLAVLCQLVKGECNVSDLQKLVGLSQSALSQHLARLRADGLVRTRREGTTIFYSLAGDDAVRVLEALYELYCAPTPPATPMKGRRR